mgnify:CR=1 FL=1
MFTGIIQKTGRVELVETDAAEGRLLVRCEPWNRPYEAGESIAVNGVCLTVVDVLADGSFTADVMQETLNRILQGSQKVTLFIRNAESPYRIGRTDLEPTLGLWGDSHAMALVPALEDGGRILIQSLAIMEYLDETHPAVPLLPAGALERAREIVVRPSTEADVPAMLGAGLRLFGAGAPPRGWVLDSARPFPNGVVGKILLPSMISPIIAIVVA